MRALAWIFLVFTLAAQNLPKFQGRQVTMTKTTVCLEGPPQKQCYSAPDQYGEKPAVSVMKLSGGESALFFSAQSDGISGFSIHFALLEPGTGKNLQNILFVSPVSNQSRHSFRTEPAISEAPIFLTADYSLGPGEGHYDPHRYIVSAYVRAHSSLNSIDSYYLADRYMTVPKYDLDAGADVLAAEKAEIVARLVRVKVSQTPH